MAKYRKTGQIDVYKKESSGCAGPVIGIIVVIVLIAICGGLLSDDDDNDGSSPPPQNPPAVPTSPSNPPVDV